MYSFLHLFLYAHVSCTYMNFVKISKAQYPNLKQNLIVCNIVQNCYQIFSECTTKSPFPLIKCKYFTWWAVLGVNFSMDGLNSNENLSAV